MPARRKLNTVEQELRDILHSTVIQRREIDQSVYPEPPPAKIPINTKAGQVDISPPPEFIPDPTIVGQDLTRDLSHLFKLAPMTRGRVKTARAGPDESVIKQLLESKLSPYDYDAVNLLGNIAQGPRCLTVSPRNMEAIGYSSAGVAGHELGHAAGMRSENAADQIYGLIRMLQDSSDWPKGGSNGQR